MLDQNELKKNYRRYDDNQIRRIAKNDAKALRDEAVPILIQEIKKRNLGEHLIRWINAERRKLTKSEMDSLKRKVKGSTCESCHNYGQLKGYKFTSITGLLVTTNISSYELIICEKCGKKRRRNSAIWTAFFGWWSAMGFFSTPFELMDKITAFFQEEKQSEEIIESFIRNNLRIITAGQDSQAIIQKTLKKFNNFNGKSEF
ncbi:MAG: hypothetical protein AAFZ15_07900 [Bacteroidota bacterium]